MASLSAHPTLALHLTDANLAPILSNDRTTIASSNAPTPTPRTTALTTLQTASLASYTTAARLGLGAPQRIMIETARRGPVVLHSYLAPQRTAPTQQQQHDRDHHNPEDRVLAHTRDGLHALSDSVTAAATAAAAVDNEADGTHHLAQVSSSQGSHGSESTPDARLTNGNTARHGHAWDEDAVDEVDEDDEEEAAPAAPLLIATAVAPTAAQGVEARRAVARLEMVGAEVQREWVLERRRRAEEDETEDERDERDGGEGSS